MKAIIIHGPQGCGKDIHVKAIGEFFGAKRIVGEWDGRTPLVPGDMALTNVQMCDLSVIADAVVMSFDVAMCRAGLQEFVFLSSERMPVNAAA